MAFASSTRRRLAVIVAGLGAAVILGSSCSLDAALATDSSGRVVGIHALQIRSGALDLALALALEGRRLVVELRWQPDLVDIAGLF